MTHRFPVTVHYEDTDMGGIVYHANYLKYIERARSALVADLGIDQVALARSGTAFVVRRIEADYLGAATLGDALTVTTDIVQATGARLTLAQSVHRSGTPLFQATVLVAALATATGRPARLPAELRRSRGAQSQT